MRRIPPFVAIALVIGSGLAHGKDEKSRRAFAVTDLPPIYAATLSTITATPATISFSATDPDLGSVAGSTTSTVTWSLTGGNKNQSWTLTVQAGGASFTGCATAPAAAVTVTCASASVSGGNGTGSCNGPFTLSTSPQQVAGGFEGQNYTVTINFTLTDRWRYIAATTPSCTLTLTYTVNAP